MELFIRLWCEEVKKALCVPRDFELQILSCFEGTKEYLSQGKQMQKKDELYEFRSPEESWNSFTGREGIALVRDGKIIADVITLMS